MAEEAAQAVAVAGAAEAAAMRAAVPHLQAVVAAAAPHTSRRVLGASGCMRAGRPIPATGRSSCLAGSEERGST